MTRKEFAHKIFSPIVWFNLLGMVLVIGLVCIGTIWWMRDYTHHGEGITVPNIKGKLVSDVMTELTNLQLEGVVIDSTYDKRLAPGIVLEQTPRAGAYVKAGRQIYITINTKTEPTLLIPNIIDNCSVREAEAKLQALGFIVGPCQYIEGQKDWVLGVKCRGREVYTGDRVPLTAPITLVVGNSEIEVDENGIEYENDWIDDTEDGEISNGDFGAITSDTNQDEVLVF